MKFMSCEKLRQTFIEYFKAQGHEHVASSSLIPADDPTLLFTNAGMVQFKEVFLGQETPAYSRAVSSQRCVRAGGKHNDLENVGFTARHHTFFEMLGNFSFGDYFKRDAIDFAWNFLTQVLCLPPERLWVTIFRDDAESEKIWLEEMKIDRKRFSRCGEADNFWAMGDTGPCGPCTEIFYDHGSDIPGTPPTSRGHEGDRYVEIWNLVFMQYNRNVRGELTPLPNPCVDTGMGLERIAAVMQNVHNNYDIDLFQSLLSALSEITATSDKQDTSMRVIVDHIRSITFLIVDGVTPSNEGRGYVLRRILRRAARHGYKLGQSGAFLYKLVPALVAIMGDVYPELRKAQALVEQVIKQEEKQFALTLSKGLRILEQATAKMQGQVIPGEVVFQLYDTYGFPPDLTADIARERDLTLDYAGFEQAMEKQRQQSQQASQFNQDYTQQLHIRGETEFAGYEALNCQATVTTLIAKNQVANELRAGEKGIVILDRTPFYAESGGQIGDSGSLQFEEGSFQVTNTTKQGLVFLHHGQVQEGCLQVNTKVTAEVGSERLSIMANHSATHLLHEALRRVLGEHVMQKGSLVEAGRLRFDFAHSQALSGAQIQAVEQLVNQQIRAVLPAKISVMSLDEAKDKGATALFGEKYGKEVRVITMGEFSTEVCGGTHVANSGEIGLFKITHETACAAGVRRIEAVTGVGALAWVDENEQQLQHVSDLLKTNRLDVDKKLQQLLDKVQNQERELTRIKQQLAGQQTGDLAQQVEQVGDYQLLVVELPEIDQQTLLTTLDRLKDKLAPCAIVLATVNNNRVQLVASVSQDLLAHFNAVELLNHVATQVDGKGGGRPDLARGGGEKPAALAEALKSVKQWMQKKL